MSTSTVGSHLSLVVAIECDHIDANPHQPRHEFDPDELSELVMSLQLIGLLQPIVVRNAGERYELIAGERRLRAARLAGWSTIPALVRPTADGDLLRVALLENLHRVALNPIEEAAAYRQLVDDFACTHEQLAALVGKSRSHISHTIGLLRLPAAVARRVAAGVLSAGHAKILAGLGDVALMQSLATDVIAQGLSVRDLEELVVSQRTSGLPSPRRERKASGGKYEEWALALGDTLETRVRVVAGRGRGKLVVEFADHDDLLRMCGLLGLAPPSQQVALGLPARETVER